MKGKNPLKDLRVRKALYQAIDIQSIQRVVLRGLAQPTGTLIAGDLLFLDRAPSTPTANLARWRESLDALAKLPHKAAIPGHGPFDPGGTRAIAQTRDWLDWLDATLRTAVQSGLDMVEAGALPIPDRFATMAAARPGLAGCDGPWHVMALVRPRSRSIGARHGVGEGQHLELHARRGLVRGGGPQGDAAGQSGFHLRVGQDRLQERNVGRDAANPELGERAPGPPDQITYPRAYPSR